MDESKITITIGPAELRAAVALWREHAEDMREMRAKDRAHTDMLFSQCMQLLPVILSAFDPPQRVQEPATFGMCATCGTKHRYPDETGHVAERGPRPVPPPPKGG